jgi:uncharacterized delta-60 repeat protein
MKKSIFCVVFLVCAQACFAQLSESWHTTFNGQGDFTDRYTCMIAADGFVYLGGSTQSADQNQDFLVVKTDLDGTLLWRKQFHGSGTGPDEFKSIAKHNDKIILGGYGNSIGVGNDFYTSCFSLDGDSLWTSVYNDPLFNQYDEPNDLAVASDGSIYVTGESDGDVTFNTNHDFLTIKLNSDGGLLWTKRFNGLSNGTDRAAALVVDAQGNAVVTGRSFNGGDDDYVTIKYSPTGTVLWTQTQDNGGLDRATDIGVDAASNYYVTGRRSNGNDDDYYTVKYASNGALLMEKIFDFVEDDRGEKIVVNPDGSFAVTGKSDGNATVLLNWNIYTVMYSATGVQLWASTYTGAGNNDDVPSSISLLENGQLAVGGTSDVDTGVNISNNAVMIQYDALGNAVSTVSYDWASSNDECLAITLLSDGTVIGAGDAENANGNTDAALFVEQANNQASASLSEGSGDNNENIRDLIRAADGSVYVTGYSVREGNDRDICTMKLSSLGDTLWSRNLTGTLFGSDDEVANLVQLNSGNVVIAGYIKNSGTGSDIIVQCYSPAGNALWQALYNGISNESDRAYQIVKDNNDNVYVTGKTDVDGSVTTKDEIITLKYSSAGVLLWATIHSSNLGNDRGKFVQVAPSGNVYVVGRIFDGTSEDVCVLKYSNAGVLTWIQEYDGAGNDDPTDFYLDAAENIYVAATMEETINTLDTKMALIKFDAAGNFQWNQFFAANGFGINRPEAIATDANGNIYVTGTSDSDASEEGINNDIATIKYNVNGSELWSEIMDESFDEVADDLIVSSLDQVYVVAHKDNGDITNSNYDIVVHRYNTGGVFLGSNEFAFSDSSDVPNVAVLNSTEMYIGGSTLNATEQRNYLVLKCDVSTHTDQLSNSVGNVWPNPFQAEIMVELAGTEYYELYDGFGRLIQAERVTQGGPFAIPCHELAQGMYALRLYTSIGVVVKKLEKNK